MPIVSSVPRVGRAMRNPTHTFQTRSLPFEITPFMLAPVLPGETLKNALIQSRVVTDPIKSPLIGWWLEYYLFYVPFRAMPGASTLTEMVLDPTLDTSGLNAAAKTAHYHYGGSPDFIAQCLQPVVTEYFRGPNDTWNTPLGDNYPMASLNRDSWLDSVADETTITEGTDPNTATNEEELERFRLLYEHLRATQLIDMDYNDYLRMHGIKVDEGQEPDKPELLRYWREWQYPSNTINASTGVPSSAVSWAFSGRADKDRFFKQPGFIFGVTVARPKVYLSRQYGNAASFLNDGLRWLPAHMRDELGTRLKEFAANKGPLGEGKSAGTTAPTNGYIVDVADLFVYGDQFINFALTETDAGLVALPTIAMQKRYPQLADVQGLFVGTTTATRLVRQDGRCDLHVLGTVRDET